MRNNEIDLNLLDLDSIDLSGWNLDEIDRRKDRNLVSMLSMLDAKHSIVLSDEIGLIGYGYDETPKMKVISDEVYDNKIAEFDKQDIYGFRGNYFKVVNRYGIILFDEYVDAIWIVQDSNINIKYYIFKLKDYTRKSRNDKELFFDNFEGTSAYVLYEVETDKLYVNNLNDLEVAQKIGEVTNDKFKITLLGNNNYIIYIDKKEYRSFIVNCRYKIYNCYELDR